MTTVGAVGPHSLRLSGEIADAILITCGTTPEALRQARQHIDAG
ncbi:MAG TPA: hypothetical protein VFC48_04110 [Cellulomonas sp.]|nr:hypothetical protein [Cellulomonas sp.]